MWPCRYKQALVGSALSGTWFDAHGASHVHAMLTAVSALWGVHDACAGQALTYCANENVITDLVSHRVHMTVRVCVCVQRACAF